MSESQVYSQVQQYYGETIQHTSDLKTSSCCTGSAPPKYLREILAKIHPEISDKYYGCGLVAPDDLAGTRILDIGCGYVSAFYVG
jgi:2-polyprenyl-3-methyl-5-hydroxy-6-metoxy-1,4-benzoquinol methylase